MGGSKVTKLLSPFLLVATLCLAPIDATKGHVSDPLMKDAKPQTLPINEVEIKTDDKPFSHVMDPTKEKDLHTALIRHGKEVVGNRFPFIVSLQRQSFSVDRRYHICAAILLNERTAVTAAHCVSSWSRYYRNKLWAGVGFVKLSSATGQLVKVVDVYIHRYYGSGSIPKYAYDIAVVVFEKNVTYSDSVQPAVLTPKTKRTFINSQCEIAGWGYNEDGAYPDELMYIRQYWLTNGVCRKLHRVYGYGYIHSRQLCTYDPRNSPCYGDSGGPVICDGQAAGIISWTFSCSGCFGTVHTRIASYRYWIQKMMNRANKQHF